jgi:hypothetical protein
MATDPDPEEALRNDYGQGPIFQSDADRPKFADFLKLERGMS